MTRRVVITGIGVVSPAGVGSEAFWQSIVSGTSLSSEWSEFAADDYFAHAESRRLDRFAQIGICAAAMAITDGGLPAGADPSRSAVIVGSGAGGLQTLEEQREVLRARGPARVSAHGVPMTISGAAATGIAQRLGWTGPVESIATACATGASCVLAATRLIRCGVVDRAIAGSAESALDDLSRALFARTGAISPSGRCRPFDVNRDGFALAEGAGALLLEERDEAVRRGARIYAEIAGGASTCDAYHVTAPRPDGSIAAAAIDGALRDAELAPSDIGHVNAHGTGTRLNDAAEAMALRRVFKDAVPPVVSIKGSTGHSLGGAAAIEIVAAALAIQERTIPATCCEDVDPELPLDIVMSARQWKPAPVMCNSFAFGGHNVAIVVAPVR